MSTQRVASRPEIAWFDESNMIAIVFMGYEPVTIPGCQNIQVVQCSNKCEIKGCFFGEVVNNLDARPTS